MLHLGVRDDLSPHHLAKSLFRARRHKMRGSRVSELTSTAFLCSAWVRGGLPGAEIGTFCTSIFLFRPYTPWYTFTCPPKRFQGISSLRVNLSPQRYCGKAPDFACISCRNFSAIVGKPAKSLKPEGRVGSSSKSSKPARAFDEKIS